MKLQTKQLKAFKAVAGGIKQNNILPILSYIRLHDGVITKSNNESFIEMKADFEGSLLVDERTLWGFLDKANGETIEIEKDGTQVIMIDGKRPKVKSPTDDVSLFPVVVVDELTTVELGPKVLYAVNIARNFTAENPAVPYSECIFIGGGLVAATNNFTSYTERIDDDTPNIILNSMAAAAICKYESVLFSENQGYRFFIADNITFGFGKNDISFINMQPFSKLPTGESVVINKRQLIDFCDQCVSATPPGAILTAIMDGKGTTMKYSTHMVDVELVTDIELPYFTFRPEYMGKLLKSLPDEEVTIVAAKSKLFLTGPSGFVSLIMEMSL